MTPGARIAAAIDVLEKIEKSYSPADKVISHYYRSRRYIGSKDRRAISSRVFKIIRHHARLLWWTNGGLPRLRTIASLALLDRIPKEEIRNLFDGSGYAPPPLSPYELERLKQLSDQMINDKAMPDWLSGEVPEWLSGELKSNWTIDFDRETKALNQPAPLDLRVNTLKSTCVKAIEILKFDGIKATPTPFSPTDYVWCEDWDIINTDWVCFNWELNPDFQEHLNSGEVLVQKNLHFYENVGKYNHFFMGWEQAQLVVIDTLPLENGLNNIGEDITYWNVTTLSGSPISQGTFEYNEASGTLENTSSIPWEQYIAVKLVYTKASVFDNDGYLVAKSPDKWKYRNLRDEYNKLGKVAGYAISTVMFNHVVSMIDAVISTNSYNRRKSNRISAVPVFDPNAKYGVSSITINFRF